MKANGQTQADEPLRYSPKSRQEGRDTGTNAVKRHFAVISHRKSTYI